MRRNRVLKKRLRVPKSVAPELRAVADWLNRSSLAYERSTQSELAEAIQHLILFARAWRDPETGFDEGDVQRLEEQKERIDSLLARWPARYTLSGMDERADESAFFTLTPLGDYPIDDWHHLLDLVRIAEHGAMRNLLRCGADNCRQWFYAPVAKQRFCSRKCHDSFWEGVRQSSPKLRARRKIYQREYYKLNYTKP
jgi:hypothetical protein